MNRPATSDAPTFLVERYWPGIDLVTLRPVLERLDRVAREMTAEGTPIEHVGSILMPIDEVVFSLISAHDEGLVRELNARAELPVDRITVAISLATTVSGPVGGVSS